MFFVVSVKADSIEIDNETDFKNYAANGGEIVLIDDISLTANTFVSAPLTIDLNGHTIDIGSYILVNQSELTILDSSVDQTGQLTSIASFVIQNGSSTLTDVSLIIEGGTVNNPSNYGVRNFANMTMNGGTITSPSFTFYNNGNFIMNDGLILSTTGMAYQNSDNSTMEMHGGEIKTDGTNRAMNLNFNSSAVIYDGKITATNGSDGYGAVGVTAFKDTSFTIKGGTISSYDSVLMGNGSDSGSSEGSRAKFNIEGGTLTTTHGIGIYAPQIDGEVTISGGTISGRTGIEIRAGKLTITGETIIATEEEYSVTVNTNGSTTFGAAVSVAQHTTKQEIEVNISGGTFNGITPFSETNPLENSEEDLEKITLSISGGEFNSTGDNTVIAFEGERFITGGQFTESVEEHKDENYSEKYMDDIHYILKAQDLTIEENNGGEVQLSSPKGLYKDEVTIDVTPNTDYIVDEIIVKDADNNIIPVTNNTFIMPDSEVSIEVIYKFNYKITAGNNQTFESDSKNDITITSNGTLSNLTGILVDGANISIDKYTTKNGSTILSLKSSYLKTLTDGRHTITFLYNDGSVDAILNVAITNPPTYDNISNYCITLFISLICLFSVVELRKIYNQ